MTSEVVAGVDDEGYNDASPYDGRGLWAWPNCGAGIYTHRNTPNSITPDLLWPGECVSMPDANLPCTAGSRNEATHYASARSHHPGGVNVVFVDGHVEFVPDEIDKTTWRQLAHISDGMILKWP